jgi:polyisoprenyl-teichoic acid--peptidoglycan teichoic acid transferase
MTDLKPSTEGGAHNPSVPGEPSPSSIQPATMKPAKATVARPAPTKRNPANTKSAAPVKPAQPSVAQAAVSNNLSPAKGKSAAPTKPAQPSDAQTTSPTKPNPTKGHPDSSDAPCTQSGCPGTIVDGYCDVCGSPAAATIGPATPTQPSDAQTTSPTKPNPTKGHPDSSDAPCTQSGCPGTIVDGYCDVCGSPAAATIGPATPTKPAQPSDAMTAFTTPASPAGAQAAALSGLSLSSAQAVVPSWPDPAEAEPAAPPAKRRRVLPIVLASVAATLVAVLAFAAIYVNQVERSLTQNLDREDLMPTDSTSAAHPTKEEGAADALNFVVMGYDSRDASVDSTGSLMILHLNAKRDQAYFISFPRDMWVSIPGHGNNKLNAAYGFGGPKLTVSTLEKLTDTRMDHAVLIDFQGFARLTDEVGGVSIYNNTAFSSHGFNYLRGNITLSGQRALYFVGERQALPRGDFDRAMNERNVVRAIIAKTLSTKIITDPRKLVSVVSGAAEHLTVDKGLTNSKIRSTALSLRLTDKDVQLMKAPVSGKPTKEGQRVDVVDKAKLAELRIALREDRVNEYLTKYPQG